MGEPPASATYEGARVEPVVVDERSMPADSSHASYNSRLTA